MSLLSIRSVMAIKNRTSSTTGIMLFSDRSRTIVRLSPLICQYHEQIETRSHLPIFQKKNGHFQFHPHPLLCALYNANLNSISFHTSRKYLCQNWERRDKLRLLTGCCAVHLHRRNYKSKNVEDTEEESSSDSEGDDSDDEEDDDIGNAPKTFKSMMLHVKSLRLDNIVSRAFDIARNRVDEIFYANKLRVNGEKFTKKSKQMRLGDYVDIITETKEDTNKVRRVKLVKIESEKTRTDKFIVKVKVWKAAFEIENTDTSKW